MVRRKLLIITRRQSAGALSLAIVELAVALAGVAAEHRPALARKPGPAILLAAGDTRPGVFQHERRFKDVKRQKMN